jgi:hypothetical protein
VLIQSLVVTQFVAFVECYQCRERGSVPEIFGEEPERPVPEICGEAPEKPLPESFC